MWYGKVQFCGKVQHSIVAYCRTNVFSGHVCRRAMEARISHLHKKPWTGALESPHVGTFYAGTKHGELLRHTVLYYTIISVNTMQYCTVLHSIIMSIVLHLYITRKKRWNLRWRQETGWALHFDLLWRHRETVRKIPHYTILYHTLHYCSSLLYYTSLYFTKRETFEPSIYGDAETGWAPVLHCATPFCALYFTVLYNIFLD